MQTINPYKMFVGCFVPNWLLESNIVSLGAKLCYARLCQYAGKNGKCFPSRTELARSLGCVRETAWRYVKELQDAKLINQIDKSYIFFHHPLMDDVADSQHDVAGLQHDVADSQPPIRRESLKESIREEPSKPVSKNQTPLKTVLYFFSKYKEKYNRDYPANKAKFINIFSNLEAKFSFDEYKLMIDKFLSDGHNDLQKFIWKLPDLVSVLQDKDKEKAEAERNRKYQEYYSTEAVLKRAQNGEI